MTTRELDPPLRPAAAPSEPRAEAATASDRMRRLVERHYAFLWRSLRYLGIREQDVEDAAQRVLVVVARRLGDIEIEAEQSFLFGTAMKVASEARRSDRRRRDDPGSQEMDAFESRDPGPEVSLQQRRALEQLGRVLDALPLELRVVFVLFEIEELTLSEIAPIVGVPRGTVASRLRRSRELFHAAVRRLPEGVAREIRGGRR